MEAETAPAAAGRMPVADRVPPASFFLVSAVFHYLGPALAVLLFVHVSVLGVAWLRIASAAVVFAAWRRPWRLWTELTASQRWVLAGLGVVLAAMNSLFYLAIDRLPLATVGRHRVPGHGHPGRRRRADPPQRAGAGRWRSAASALLTGAAAGRRSRWVSSSPSPTALASCSTFCSGHRIANRAPDGSRHRPADRWRHRPAGRGHAGGRGGRHAVRVRRCRPAAFAPPGVAAVGNRGRRVLVGHPLRHATSWPWRGCRGPRSP